MLKIFYLLILLQCLSFEVVLANTSQLSTLSLSQLESAISLAGEAEYHDYEKQLVRHIQQHPSQPFNYYLMATLYRHMFSSSPNQTFLLNKSYELSTIALDLAPHLEYGYISLAETLELAGKNIAAQKILSQALDRIQHPSWRYYFTVAKITTDHSSQNKDAAFKRTQHFIETALEYKHAKLEIIIPYYLVLLDQNLDSEAYFEELLRLDTHYPSYFTKLKLAKILQQKQRFDQAVNILRYVEKSESAKISHVATLNIARILYFHLNKNQQALSELALLRQTLLKDLSEDNKRFLHQIYIYQADIFAKLNQSEDSLYALQFALDVDIDSWNILAGVSLDLHQRYSQAGAHINFLKHLNATLPNAETYSLLGEALSEWGKDRRQGIKPLQAALLLEPKNDKFMYSLGVAHYYQKDYELAKSYFKQASLASPHIPTYSYNLACIYAILGEHDKSLQSLRAAISLDSKYLDMAQQDQDFASLHLSEGFKNLTNHSVKNTLQEDDIDFEKNIESLGSDIFAH